MTAERIITRTRVDASQSLGINQLQYSGEQPK